MTMISGLMHLCALQVRAAADDGAPSAGGATGASPGEIHASATPSPASVVLTEKPATVQVPLTAEKTAEIEQALAEGDSPKTVKLSVSGVVPPDAGSKVSGFKVYIDKPNATAESSENDPHFVGAVSFQATTDASPQSFALDLKDALMALKHGKLGGDHNLTLTFVPLIEGQAANANTNAVKMPIRSVEVLVPKQSPKK